MLNKVYSNAFLWWIKDAANDAYGILGKQNFTDWLISDEILNWLVWFEHPNFSSMS